MVSIRIARPLVSFSALASLLTLAPRAVAQAAPTPPATEPASVTPAPAAAPREASPEPILVGKPSGASAPTADIGLATWTAGYHNGNFFIRDASDVFRLYVQGRVHADWADQFGAGTGALPPGSQLNNGFYLRRARLELGGEFYETWQWQMGAELSSSTSVDNLGATQATPTLAVNPTTGAITAVNRENAVDNPTVKALPTDVFVNYGPSSWANIEVGQFFIPFTLENRISDNTTPFLERALPVRAIGAPLQRDIGVMFWGESPDRFVYYAVSVVNGDGPNRANPDNNYDVAGRVLVRPLAKATERASKWTQIGLSARGGSRDPKYVGYDAPALTTQEGYAFWKPTYKDSLNRFLHILPSDGQWAIAVDVYVPIENFDFTGEFIFTSTNTREAVDGYQLSPFTERTGDLKGFGWYAQASYWIFGDHDIIGYPPYARPIHVDLNKPQKPAKQGLQVLAKFEQLKLTYGSAARGGSADSKSPDGDINVNTIEFGVNYWATKHLRVGLNYGLYTFPDSAPVSATTTGGPQQTPAQRAVAPGQLLAKGLDDAARDTSHTLNELSLRVGVQF